MFMAYDVIFVLVFTISFFFLNFEILTEVANIIDVFWNETVCILILTNTSKWRYVFLCLWVYRGLGFDSRRYQIFWLVVCLERGPLSLVRSIEELLE